MNWNLFRPLPVGLNRRGTAFRFLSLLLLLASLGAGPSMAQSAASLLSSLGDSGTLGRIGAMLAQSASMLVFPCQTSSLQQVYLGKFIATCYWRVDELEEGAGPRTIRIRVIDGLKGSTRMLVSLGFKRRLDVEGTAILQDGRVLNVTSRNGVYSDTTARAPTGLGARGQGLVPFRSIAISSTKRTRGLAHGDRIFIPQAVGLELPFGFIHDGYFIVNDVGSRVRGIDIYSLTKELAIRWGDSLNIPSKHLALYRIGARR